MFIVMQGEIDCMVVDVSWASVVVVGHVALECAVCLLQRAYGGIAHADAQPGYRAYYPDGTRYPQFKGFKGLSALWPFESLLNT